MPARVVHLWEKMHTEANCIEAEVQMAKHKKKNRFAIHIKNHPDKYGATLYAKLETYEFHPYREVYIQDSYKGKTRHLKIPCLEDQAAMQAWLNIATPYIERHNYFYNCGSIPNAGQTRAVNALKRWFNTKKPPKWGGITDIRKFYDTCPHWVVMNGLKRIFKDKRFLAFAKKILSAMSSTGVGLAIGFPVSHWFANVALMELDHELKRMFPDVRFTRFMDDIGLTSKNKRHLRKAIFHLRTWLKRHDMRIKDNWQLFPVNDKGLTFLSYRFFHHYTLLTKKLMCRISRKMRRAVDNMSLHVAQGITSYMGILKHCDCYHFRQERVYPFVNPKKCRRLISRESKNLLRKETHKNEGRLCA